jgi:hypothetical protein
MTIPINESMPDGGFPEAIKPAWNDKEMLTFFRTAMADAVRFGLTSSALK